MFFGFGSKMWVGKSMANKVNSSFGHGVSNLWTAEQTCSRDEINSQTRLVLVGDHILFRQCVRKSLDVVSGFNVVIEIPCDEHIYEKISYLEKDVVIIILESNIIKRGFLEYFDKFVTCQKQANTLVVADPMILLEIRKYIVAEKIGCILNSSEYAELIQAICKAKKGEPHISSQVYRAITNMLSKDNLYHLPSNSGLSRREQEILKLIAAGMPRREISKKLSISLKTVSAHRDNIRYKLDLKNTAEIISYALSHGML